MSATSVSAPSIKCRRFARAGTGYLRASSASRSAINRHRRALEAYAVARWADLRRKDKDAYVSNIIALGDFNLPKVVR